MNKVWIFKFIFMITIFFIVLPLIVLALWSIAKSWAFPYLLPQEFSDRGINEIFGGYSVVIPVLISSIFIALCVSFLSAIIGTLTARVLVFHDFRLKDFVKFINLLPLMVPVTAFAMGIHVIFIKIGLSDTVVGVIIVHLICSIPYSVNIMTDITRSTGKNLEEQALILGATPMKAFLEISFHAILPGLIASICMGYIISFSQYFITLIIGGGNVRTLSTLMIPYIQSGDRTISGAYSMVFVFSTLIIFGIIEWISKKITSDKTIFLYR